MIKPLFDQVFAAGGADALIWVGGAILGLFLLRAITSVLGRWLLTRVNQTAAARMQADLVRHLLTLDGSFFQTNSPGTLIERVQGDTVGAQGAATMVITGVGRDVVALDRPVRRGDQHRPVLDPGCPDRDAASSDPRRRPAALYLPQDR